MSVRKYEYIEVENPEDFPSIEIKEIKGFAKLADLSGSNFIFHTQGDSTSGGSDVPFGYFMVLIEKILYKIKSLGYKNLDDYEDAFEKGFPACAEYYEARKGNYQSYKEYVECLKTGTTDRALFLKAQKAGFIDGYEEFAAKAQKMPQVLPPEFTVPLYDNGIKLCQYALNNNFKDFGDFIKIIFLGFPSQDVYNIAKAKGFSLGEDYFNALKCGFDNPREYHEAIHLKIKNKIEYNKYDKLRNLSKNIFGFDQILLVEALKTYENYKKLSISKLKELLEKTEQDYVYGNGEHKNQPLPEWFSKKLNSSGDFIEFLTNNKDLMQFGIFDRDGEYFEVSRMSDMKIYVDGSNVAYSEEDRQKSKPKIYNLYSMAKTLKLLRYKEIIIIADASLQHKVNDESFLSKLKEVATYLESPANTSADEFLIQQAKKEKCFIVSNDKFRDWCVKDSWIAANIDSIRIPFMKINDSYSLPALERLKG